MKDDKTRPASYIAGIDIAGLVYLLGEIVAPCDPVDCRRHSLLDGLGEWIGAAAWFWLRPGDPASWQHGLEAGAWRRFVETGDLHEASIPGALGMGNMLHLSRGKAGASPVYVALFRLPDQPAFTAREGRLAGIVLDEVGWLYDDGPADEDPGTFSILSPRQAVIAGLLLQGWDRKNIARRLEITPNTLAGYIKTIYRRLGIRSQAALIQACARGQGEDGRS